MLEKSKVLFDRAQQSIPGGVNSPVRAFKSVGGTPVFMQRAKGAYLYDADGNQYIDFINSWGPMILGHAYEPVIKAIQEKGGRFYFFWCAYRAGDTNGRTNKKHGAQCRSYTHGKQRNRSLHECHKTGKRVYRPK